LPILAAELAALPVDVIQAVSTAAARAAKAATTTVPIVFQIGGDPVQRGLVTSLAHPGGNMTGYGEGQFYEDKMLQLLKEVVPGMSRVGWLSRCAAPPAGPPVLGLAVARALGVEVQCIKYEDLTGLANALASMANANIGGFVFSEQAWTTSVHYKQIADFASTHRLPTVAGTAAFTKAGGLLYYGPKPGQADAHAAALVDKILRGAKPADLPIMQPTHFAFIVNLKTAQTIGLTIPSTVLARADQVIQ
jgi:putative ABC transport system substrate-binding protein